MSTVTITIPESVKSELGHFSWVNWSEAAKEELVKAKENTERLEKFKKIISKSKLTEKDANELAEKIKEGMHKRLKDEGLL